MLPVRFKKNKQTDNQIIAASMLYMEDVMVLFLACRTAKMHNAVMRLSSAILPEREKQDLTYLYITHYFTHIRYYFVPHIWASGFGLSNMSNLKCYYHKTSFLFYSEFVTIEN